MNIELIRQNLDACEKEMKNGKEEEACERAFLTARMLISQAAPVFDTVSSAPTDIDKLRKIYISYMGTANELHSLFIQIAPYFNSLELAVKLKERIVTVNEMFERKRAELEEEEKRNEKLLQEEKKLKQEEAELKNLRDKVKELSQLQEKELQNYRNEIAYWKDLKTKLKDTCEECRKELSLLKAELDENSALIRNMPDTLGVKSVDDLIKYAKSLEPDIQEKRSTSAEVIDRILEEIERIHTKEKQYGY